MNKIYLRVTHVVNEESNEWGNVDIFVCEGNAFFPHRKLADALVNEASKFHIVSLEVFSLDEAGKENGHTSVPAELYQQPSLIQSHPYMSQFFHWYIKPDAAGIHEVLQALSDEGRLCALDVMDAVAKFDNFVVRTSIQITHNRIKDEKGSVEIIELSSRSFKGAVHVQFRRPDDDTYFYYVSVKIMNKTQTSRYTYTMIGISPHVLLTTVAGMLS